MNLLDHSRKTQTQEFIEIYNTLKSEGALDEEKIMEVGKSMLEDRLKARREDAIARNEAKTSEAEDIRAEPAPKKTHQPIRQVEIADILAAK